MPARPRTALNAAKKYKVKTWDEMVAEANADEGIPVFELPLGKKANGEDDVIEIPCPSGDSYMNIVQGQRTGDIKLIFENLILDQTDRIRLRTKMKNAGFRIVDVLTSEVLAHYFGLTGVEDEADEGNSPAS